MGQVFDLRYAIGRMLMSQVARLAAPGLVIGAVAGIFAAQLARGMLAGISPADPLSIGLAWLVLSAIAVLAGLVPAVGATRISPLDALRHE